MSIEQLSLEARDRPPYWAEGCAYLSGVDETLRSLIERFGGAEEPTLCSRGDLFYTLAHAIVGQQISATAAAAIWGRLCTLLGEVTGPRLLSIDPIQLKETGLSTRKVEYLRGGAAALPELEALPWGSMSDEEVSRALCALRGVGPWTAEMVLIFALNRPDILPLGDIGVIRAVEKLYAEGARLSKAEVERIAAPWRPYRSVAVWYLWRTIDAEPVAY